uniref:Uncharacterized protein n=1 Tax=Panagrolaimus sp. JU765 TaxID=591449 RepID=A0AC34RPQ6_9BILA
MIFAAYSEVNKASLASDFCKFDEDLKEELRKIECENEWDDCATKARTIIQEYQTGTWGVVVVADKQDILDDKIEWNISKVDPDPYHCRLLLKDKILMEVFRTGYRKKDINIDQRNFIWNLAKVPPSANMNICPHGELNQIVASFSVQHHTSQRPRGRHNMKSVLHAAATLLSSLFYDEIGHQWNVFIMDESVKVGLSLPHYYYDAKAGFCIGRTADGYIVNAAAVGYSDEYAESKSRGK